MTNGIQIHCFGANTSWIFDVHNFTKQTRRQLKWFWRRLQAKVWSLQRFISSWLRWWLWLKIKCTTLVSTRVWYNQMVFPTKWETCLQHSLTDKIKSIEKLWRYVCFDFLWSWSKPQKSPYTRVNSKLVCLNDLTEIFFSQSCDKNFGGIFFFNLEKNDLSQKCHPGFKRCEFA